MKNLNRFSLSFFAVLTVFSLSLNGCGGGGSEPIVIVQPPGLTDYEKSQMTEEEIVQELADRAAKAAAKTPE